MGSHERGGRLPTGEYPAWPTGEYPIPLGPGISWREETVKIPESFRNPATTRDAAYTFLRDCGLDPTPDAVGQLVEAFLPCLRKMCDSDHPWDPDGGTWRESGSMGALTDIRKKFKRFWYRAWAVMAPHDDPAAVDSAVDAINFFGFWLRSDDDGWNEWGEPGSGRKNA